MNVVCLLGKFGRKPEVKEVGEKKTHLCEFAVAVSKYSGGKTESVWIDCRAWGKTADNISKYFDKGMAICIEGEIGKDTWKDKEDKNHSKYFVLVNKFDFASNKNSIVQMPDFSEAEKKEPEKQTSVDDFINVPDGEFPELMFE